MGGFFRSITRVAETRKFWIAFVVAWTSFVSQVWDVDLAVDEEVAGALVGLVASVVGPLLVWRVPNGTGTPPGTER